MIDIVAPL